MTARITTLPNGLRVVTQDMPWVETVSLGAWVGVGTRNEPAEINGVAHLLEHMAFKGTEQRSARDIAEEIENVGGHLNAYTSHEQTTFSVKVLKDDMPLGVDILADILQHSTFDADELERERGVIIQEIGQAADTPDDAIFDRFQERAFPDQALGRPVLGKAEIIQTIDRKTVASYMNQHYSPDRMVLSVAGALDHDCLVDLVERLFTDLPVSRNEPVEAARYQGGDQREDKDLEQVHLMLGFPGVSYADSDYYAASTLSTILGGGMSSRLFQEIREKRGLVYTIYSFASSYTDTGIFGIYAGTGEHEIEELMPVLCDEIVKTADSMTEEEVARARTQIKAGILMGLESTAARCEHVASQLLIYGRPIEVPELVRKIDEVDLTAVQRLARRIFAAPPTFTALGPIAKVEGFDRILDRLKA